MMPGIRNWSVDSCLSWASFSSCFAFYFSVFNTVSVRSSMDSSFYFIFLPSLSTFLSISSNSCVSFWFVSFKLISSPLDSSLPLYAYSLTVLISRASFWSYISKRLLNWFSSFFTRSSIEKTLRCDTSFAWINLVEIYFEKSTKPLIVSFTGAGILCHSSSLIK